MIKLIQDMVERLPLRKRSQVALRYEPVNLSQNATVQTVQSYLRSAEGGDTRQLFALYRDMTGSGTHIQAEFSKRKLGLLSQPLGVIPADRTNRDDLAAAEACKRLVDGCENWNDGLVHLMDACLWPVSVAEKIYKPSDQPGLQYLLKRLAPVNATLLCFREPGNGFTRPGAGEVTVDERWEPELRFYSTFAEGRVDYAVEHSYAAEAARHVVHRGHLLVGMRDCWGGPMRSLVFWWLLATLGRDWFARGMERWGAPFPVGRTDAKDQQKITFLQEAFSLSTKIGGLVVDNATQVELKEIAASGMADGYEKFLNVCNREISKAVVGQTLSAEAQSTGLGSSVGKLHSEVREDIRQWDQVKLGETVKRQIFEPFLRINGIKGRAPTPSWGGLDTEASKVFAESLDVLKRSGFEPTDEAIATVSDRMGYPVRRIHGNSESENGKNGTGVEQEATEEIEEEVETLNAGLSPAVRERIALLSAQEKMAEQMGVPGSWLNPLREFLEELQAKAADAALSDQDLMDFLEQAVKRVPELFKEMDTEDLARVLEAGMGEAVMSEVRRGLRKVS